MAFELHPRLSKGGFQIGEIGRCQLLLKNNRLFPWFILVPEVEKSIEDLHELEPDHYIEVMMVVRLISQFVSGLPQVEKLNVGCIGNQIRQMHIHIIGRSEHDSAWPGTVWACDQKESYPIKEVETIRSAAREFLKMD
jgi:diadenosine tetraphosphate (Ap4A) HIT family hydrolase